MDFFLILFLVGFVGLATMAVIGFGHHGDHGGHGGHGHHDGGGLHLGHGHVGHGHVGHGHHGGHAHAGHGHAGHHHEGHAHDARFTLLAFLSPRVIFAFALGAGAAGLIVRPLIGSVFALGIAVLAGVVFELALARPLFRLADRFVSRPALTIESALYDEAEAVTGFNAAGEGMIRLNMDGQVRQVLAVLTSAERAAGVRVRAGEKLRVEEVNAVQNKCVVSRRSIES